MINHTYTTEYGTRYDLEYSIGTYYTETTDMHRWFAVDTETGERIGELYADLDRHIIMNVEVNEDHRGEGIATALYETAAAQLGDLLHAPEAACTPEGLEFSQAVGGDRADDMAELHM
ncbi:GNAT family N-acetyltransferase [Cutibacterium avidum]|uniref:GNAT family N-acetyltransferase n=1 Tax=Cutibacterium avidum TaxID=33010 RepID=UPI002095AFB0|nr:GNAT family N-acetyltransferase [Cutibacterium avidum]MCO6688349.1 hypothetical protein [Cutibacterium avidum]MDU5841486.1 hypothetical protein [Cutibacterium avidum]